MIRNGQLACGGCVRVLCYRLYTFCCREKWVGERRDCTTLAIVWPELTRLAQE